MEYPVEKGQYKKGFFYMIIIISFMIFILSIMISIISKQIIYFIFSFSIIIVFFFWIFNGLLSFPLISNGRILKEYFIFPYSVNSDITIPLRYQRTFRNIVSYDDLLFIKCCIANNDKIKQFNQYFDKDLKEKINKDNVVVTNNIVPYISKSNYMIVVTSKIAFLIRGDILKDSDFHTYIKYLIAHA